MSQPNDFMFGSQIEGSLQNTDSESGTVPRVMVSVVIPMRNEAKHIEACLRSLTEQTYPPDSYEIIIADGNSTDGSREIVSSFREHAISVRMLDNPLRTTPSGMNVAIRAALGKIIVIAGAHAIYPPEFVQNSVLWLARTNADAVGGPVNTGSAATRFGARLASMILSSPFGVGNSRFRTSSNAGYVDTVPFGAYRREILDRVGLFNERLLRNQDNDLSERIRRAGGRIYFTPALTVNYDPATGFCDLVSQAFRKSQWHAVTLRENVRALGVRHICPAIFVASVIGLLFATLGNNRTAGLLLVTTLIVYLIGSFWAALRFEKRTSKLVKSAFIPACLVYHFAYGLGTLYGIRHLYSRNSSNPL